MSTQTASRNFSTWWICGLLLCASTINYMDRQTLSIVSPQIKAEFGISSEQYGWVELAFGMAFALGATVFGIIADRINVRWLYPIVLFLWSVMAFLTGFAETFIGLLLCRTFLGLFESGHWPCALKTTHRLLPPESRTLGNSVLQSGTSIGAVATPLIIGLMVTGIPASVPTSHVPEPHVAIRATAEPDAEQALPIDGNSQTAHESEDETPPQKGNWRLAFQIIAGVGVLWIVAWLASTNSADLAPIPRPTLSTGESIDDGDSFYSAVFSRKFLVLVIIVVAINACWHLFRVWMPLFLQEGRKYSPETMRSLVFWWYIVTDVGCIVAGFASRILHNTGYSVHGSRCVVFGICGLLVATGGLIPWLPAGPGLIVVLMVVALGALGLFPCYYAFSQELSTRHQGKVTGLLGTIAWVTSSPLHPILGRWADRTKSYDLGMSLACGLPLCALFVLLLFWPENKPETEYNPAVSLA